MIIDVISDTVCPWCFIGKRRLERALAEAKIDEDVLIGWRPFQLNPDMPAGGMDRRQYLKLKFGGDGSGGQMYEAVRAAGEGEQIPFDFSAIQVQPNTVISHRLIHYAGRLNAQDAVVEGLFRAYFTEGRNIGEIDVLIDVAEKAGLDAEKTRSFLESDEATDHVREEDQVARRIGVQGVPCFIINRKYVVSGAQEPETFLRVFDMILNPGEDGPDTASASNTGAAPDA